MVIVIPGFIIAMLVLFFHACTWDKQIFAGIRKLINEKSQISKPIYNCPICMSPYYGIPIYYLISITPIIGNSISISDWNFIQFLQSILSIGVAAGFSVFSVIAIYIKDYCKSRTRKRDDECC